MKTNEINPIKKFMTRSEWIEEAKKIGYSEKEIAKWLKIHDDDEKKDNIIIPYELLPLIRIEDYIQSNSNLLRS